MEFTYRPITLWPGAPTRNRKRNRFRASYSDTLKVLDLELRMLRASQIVLQVALSEEDIRLDGKPRAGSRPSHPGVILAFKSKYGPLSYPCDTFASWEENLRAIALALTALRTVDRYGVTRRAEQYRGWSQLPPPLVTEPPMDNAAAYTVFAQYVNGDDLNKNTLADIYRRAVKATHPDTGGDAAAFSRVQRAKEVLEKLFSGND